MKSTLGHLIDIHKSSNKKYFIDMLVIKAIMLWHLGAFVLLVNICELSSCYFGINKSQWIKVLTKTTRIVRREKPIRHPFLTIKLEIIKHTVINLIIVVDL